MCISYGAITIGGLSALWSTTLDLINPGIQEQFGIKLTQQYHPLNFLALGRYLLVSCGGLVVL